MSRSARIFQWSMLAWFIGIPMADCWLIAIRWSIGQSLRTSASTLGLAVGAITVVVLLLTSARVARTGDVT